MKLKSQTMLVPERMAGLFYRVSAEQDAEKQRKIQAFDLDRRLIATGPYWKR
jgi:hypothetical protein